MSKRLRAILASLLVFTLLVTSLSFAALSEAAPAESAETQAEATEVSVEEPATEALAEEPAAEVTEAPAEEPEVEATETPAEEPEVEATEAPAEEPAAEATEAPVEESTEDGNESSETSGELSDAQKETLENLPTGFSAETVALAMMRSTGCAHTCLYVEENCDSEQCTALNDEKHAYTYRVKSRKLKCDDCGKTLQEITVNETVSRSERHNWTVEKVGKKITIKCYDCDKTKTVSKPCSHNDSFWVGEDGNLHCWECGAIEVLNPEQTYCKHKNYTEYGTKASPLVEYVAFSKEQHVKNLQTMKFIDGYSFAICDDCSTWLELKNGKVISVGGTDYPAEDSEFESVLEPHTFENGVCKFCGEKQTAKICDHSAGNFRDELDESVSPKYFNITETTHCVQYSYKRYCKDCGAYIKNVVDEGITPEAHDFSKGNTCLCGYQKQEEDEQKPYVCGFTMSQTTAKVGDTVKFTLELANVKDGEVLELQFIADGQLIETFSLTAPQNTFEHEFSKAGNRKLQFRVTGGECCPEQTLKVETNAPKVETVSLSLGTDKNFTITEKAEGEKITAKIACNENTGIAELYVGESYAFSEEYVEENGKRIFALEITLGGNNASYAGEYKMRANALKQRYVVDDMDKQSIGTLTVKHDFSGVEPSVVGSGWDSDAKGHKHWQKLQWICTVCGETSNDTVYEAKQEHSFNAEDKCSKCGYNLHINKANTVIHGEVVTGAWDENNKGEIRAMTQGNYGGSQISSKTYSSAYWGSLNGNAMCNRAAASMALSYIGIDALPKDFSDGNKYIKGEDSVEGTNSFMKDRGVNVTKIKDAALTLEGFKQLFERYNNDSSYTYSPVLIYTNYLSSLQGNDGKKYTKQSAHWLVVYAQDPENSDYYLVLDSGGGNYAHVKFAEENGQIIIAEYQYRNSNGVWKTSEQYGTKVGTKDAYKKDEEGKIYNTGTKVKYNMIKILQYNL